MISHYDWPGGREAMLRFGPAGGPVVVAALPLFEEANRTRAFVAGVLRRLAEFGIAGVLPELPGTGESLMPTEEATLEGWRAAFSACCASFEGPVHVAAMRGGVLVDADADIASRWHLAPASGASIARDLLRTRLAAGLDKPGADTPVVEVAGNLVSRRLLDALSAAEPFSGQSLRVVREAGDARPADAYLEIPRMWRMAEPSSFPSYSSDIGDDLYNWIRACGG